MWPDYVSYLLRLWRVNAGDEPDPGEKAVWRASLEDPNTREQKAFASLDELVDYLRERTGQVTWGQVQFIFTSVLGADVNNPLPFIQAKAEIEAYLGESEVPYTILAPNFFMESWVGMVVGLPLAAGQPVTLVGEGRRQHAFVSAVDVAAFAAAVVGHPAAMNAHIAIGGPEPLSWCDVVVTFERLMGQDIPLRFISPGESVPGTPEIVTTMLPALETFDSPVPMAETTRTFGVELTPLQAYVSRTLAAAAS